ncbi:MAG: hypothetical protein K2N44_11745 [Lachnospiraceae bacterium]|nr:hypothetical protein [Lachnospiraceae bacterium]
MKQKKVIMLFVMAGMVLAITSCSNVQHTASGQMEIGNNTEVSESNSDKNKDIGTKEFSSDGTIEETVIMDEGDIKITVTDLSYTDYDVRLI